MHGNGIPTATVLFLVPFYFLRQKQNNFQRREKMEMGIKLPLPVLFTEKISSIRAAKSGPMFLEQIRPERIFLNSDFK